MELLVDNVDVERLGVELAAAPLHQLLVLLEFGVLPVVAVCSGCAVEVKFGG
jgi:hypothetical protein